MKRCPECRRDYYDDTLSFCLDDGAHLVDGPASNELATAMLPGSTLTDEAQTKRLIENTGVTAILTSGPSDSSRYANRFPKFWLLGGLVAVLAAAGFFAYRSFAPIANQAETIAAKTPEPAPKLYWQMSETEQSAFIQQRSRHVQTLIGDEPADLDPKALTAIKEEIDDYVEDKDSLSQKPFEEGLRAIYGRASQFAPLVSKSYDARKVPPALGIYQAMVESEYHDCPKVILHPRAPVGLFQFRRSTAALYGLQPDDYCDVQKQCDAAARLMSDLISDFGSEKSSWTLALFSFNSGAEKVRDYLRQLRGRGVTERSFWAVFRHQAELQSPMSEQDNRYVPRFFAAAIIGESPEAFELSTPPLTTLRVGGS